MARAIMAVPVAPNIIPFFVRVFVCCDLVARHGRVLTVHGTAGRVVQTIIRDLTTFNICVSQSSDQAGHSIRFPRPHSTLTLDSC